MRRLVFLPFLLLAGCNSEIYTRDGVTDGDSFYLAPHAFEDDDPVLQSWVTYSLMKSTCQLEIGDQIPARASSYRCELTARQQLVDAWGEQRRQHAGASDSYLDTLLEVTSAGYLEEYTAHYLHNADWVIPEGLRADEFRRWQGKHLRRHRPETRIIGSWGYRQR